MRILLIAFLCGLSSCWTLRAYKVRKLRLSDHERLPSVAIKKADHPFQYQKANKEKQYLDLKNQLDSSLEDTETAAFLVIRNDSIIYERYDMGITEQSLLPSNSMAKSFVGTLTGIALDEGKIRSDRDPITAYLPELAKRDPRFTKITIRHLLDMRSGLHFNEGSYNLKDDAVRLGFRPDLKKHILKIRIAEPPGNFKYQSINTMLLGLIIERATGQKVEQYLEEKIWQPMGAAHDATWNVDSKRKKQVIISAGINATAQDFTKLGRLYLKKGKLKEEQILSKDRVRTITSIDTMERYEGYKDQWWNRRVNHLYEDSLKAVSNKRRKRYSKVIKELNSYQLSYRTEAFSAIGFMHQIIYVHPKKNLIIARFGRRWHRPAHFTQFVYNLGEQL